MRGERLVVASETSQRATHLLGRLDEEEWTRDRMDAAYQRIINKRLKKVRDKTRISSPDGEVTCEVDNPLIPYVVNLNAEANRWRRVAGTFVLLAAHHGDVTAQEARAIMGLPHQPQHKRERGEGGQEV